MKNLILLCFLGLFIRFGYVETHYPGFNRVRSVRKANLYHRRHNIEVSRPRIGRSYLYIGGHGPVVTRRFPNYNIYIH